MPVRQSALPSARASLNPEVFIEGDKRCEGETENLVIAEMQRRFLRKGAAAGTYRKIDWL